MNKLLPCPLCGAEALDMGGDHCCCSSDGCALGEMGNMMSIHRDEWNARHTPEGWKLVPNTPTLEMQKSYFASIDDNMARVQSDLRFGRFDNQRLAYRHMLAAAPKWGGE